MNEAIYLKHKIVDDTVALNPDVSHQIQISSYKTQTVVHTVVRALVTVRNNTFRRAQRRLTADYTPYPADGGEHPTQYYPSWRIIR